MTKTCNQCHSVNFARSNSEGDDMIREADHLMAEAIRVVAGLYRDGVLPKPQNYAYLPTCSRFTTLDRHEQEAFVMYLEHRMRAFQGTFTPAGLCHGTAGANASAMTKSKN